MHAGDWRNTDRNPSDDGYRINARAGASMPGTGPGTGNTSIPMGRGFGGLNYFNALQNRNLPAFRQPNQGTPWGMGNSAQEAGANMTQGGNLLRADGTYVPDTMYNRTLGSMNPYGGNQAPQQAPQGPNEDQQRWAEKFAGSQAPSSSGATPFADALKNVRSHPLIAGKGGQSGNQPLNFSRSALIQGAQKSGEFGKIMEDYNAKAKAAGTGMQMDDRGNINPLSKLDDGSGTSPFARATLGAGAEDIRARRDFNRGESLDKSVSNGVGTLTKINPYGSAGATYGGKPTGPGMMPDPLTGKMVPMRQWAADQSSVQATKYAPFPAQSSSQVAGKTVITPTRSAVALTPSLGAVSNPYGRPLNPNFVPSASAGNLGSGVGNGNAGLMSATGNVMNTWEGMRQDAMKDKRGPLERIGAPVNYPMPSATMSPDAQSRYHQVMSSLPNATPSVVGGEKPLNAESGQRLKDAVSGKAPIQLSKPASPAATASSSNLQKANPYNEPRTQNNTKLAPFFTKKHQGEIDEADSNLKYHQEIVDRLQSPSGQVGGLKFGDVGYTRAADNNIKHSLKRIEEYKKAKAAAEQKLKAVLARKAQ
jgi:hypothetical protein